MSNYDDMLDFQRREQYGDDYITPTVAYTGQDMADLIHDCGDDVEAAMDIANAVMEKDMERYENQRVRQLQARISYLEEILDDQEIDD